MCRLAARFAHQNRQGRKQGGIGREPADRRQRLTSMRRQRTLLALVAVILGVVVLQDPAGADCAGPEISHDTGEFSHHSTVTVTGRFFGDNCYDTGPPPEGEGSLGRPLTAIEVLLVQDGSEWVVASGNADESYTFEVEITIPADVAPGHVEVAARWPGSGGELGSNAGAIMVVAGNTDNQDVLPATFGPEPVAAATSEATSPRSEPAEDDAGRGRWIAAGMVIAAAALGGLVVLPRR